MKFEGACHVALGPSVLPEVEAAVAFTRSVGWGGLLRLGGPEIPASRWTRVSTVRQRYAEAARATPAQFPVIYHQLEGLELFATEDSGRIRFLWVHEPLPRWGEAISWAARFADAFIFDDVAWERAVAEAVDWLPARRRVTLPAARVAPVPLHPAPTTGTRRHGWVGRLEVEQHRADRLPAVVRAWQEAGGRGEIEICGDGLLRARLQKALAAAPVRWFPLKAWADRVAGWCSVFATAEEVGAPWPAWVAVRNGRTAWLPHEGGLAATRPGSGRISHYPAGLMEILGSALVRTEAEGGAPPPPAVEGRHEQGVLDPLLELRRVRSQGSPTGRFWPYGWARRQLRVLARGG